MKGLKLLLSAVAIAIISTSVFGQGITVFKKNGERLVFPYEMIDSIVTYDYDEQPPELGKKDEVKTFTVNGVSFNMLLVKGGTFTMGATEEQTNPYSDEFPTHSVTLYDYYLGETLVTQALWTAVTGNSPTADGSAWNATYGLGDNYPAYYISYTDVQAFITQLNKLTGAKFRMPTEAEWEYAARGGEKANGYKYSGSNNVDDVAWYSANSGNKTNPVAQKLANELGLYDMSGNVWEWVSDWYGTYSADEQTNPKGPETGDKRSCRGGRWSSDERGCRVSNRFYGVESNRSADFGFRLALD